MAGHSRRLLSGIDGGHQRFNGGGSMVDTHQSESGAACVRVDGCPAILHQFPEIWHHGLLIRLTCP